MGAGSAADKLATAVAMQVRRRRVEELLLAGLCNLEEIGIIMGVTGRCIGNDVRAIREQWRTIYPTEMEDRRLQRIQEIEMIRREAWKAFERSKKSKLVTTIVEKECDNCLGGYLEVKDAAGNPKKKVCPKCGGDAKITVETQQRTDQPGDPKFLTVALACVNDCARIEGLLPSPAASALSGLKRTVERQLDDGGRIHERVEELYWVAPEEEVIKCMAALDSIRAKAAESGKKVIDVTPREEADDESNYRT